VKERDAVYLEHVLGAIDAILRFTSNGECSAFETDAAANQHLQRG